MAISDLAPSLLNTAPVVFAEWRGMLEGENNVYPPTFIHSTKIPLILLLIFDLEYVLLVDTGSYSNSIPDIFTVFLFKFR